MRLTNPERRWVTGPDTGRSSRAIFAVMTDLPVEAVTSERVAPVPSDPGDFARCVRLLDLFPAWRVRITDMGAYSPAWAALVSQWDELETLYRTKLPDGPHHRLWYRMTELAGPHVYTDPADVTRKLDFIAESEREYHAAREIGRVWVTKGWIDGTGLRVEAVDEPLGPDPKVHVRDLVTERKRTLRLSSLQRNYRIREGA